MANYSRLSRATLTSRLQDRAGDAAVFWLPEEHVTFLNEAVAVWQAMTGMWVEEFDITVTTGNYYDVPRQLMSLQRVSWNGVSELSLTSLHELDYGYPGWEAETAIDPPLYWAPVGLNKLAVYPKPESGFLHLEGIREAPLLFSSGDFIDVGDEEVTKLLTYGQHVATFKEGTTEMDSTKGAIPLMATAAGYLNGRLKATNFYRRALGLPRQETQEPRAHAPEVGGRL